MNDACHSCDNSSCFEGAHLSWGTRQRNVLDNRDRLGTHATQKLTRDQAYFIKYHSPKGRGCQAALAREYGVSPVTISHIITGLQWADL